MKKKRTGSIKSEHLKRNNAHNVNALKNIKPFFTDRKIEIIVAILLGITMLLSAWATWIGSLHSGVQAINFTKSNNISSEGTAEYNMGMQIYLSDYMAWTTLRDYYYELEALKSDGDQTKIDLANDKIDRFKEQNISDILAEGVKWMEDNNEDTPFNMPGMSEKYFASAQEKMDQSRELLEEGMRDNTKGDSFNLVTVVYSLTLFLLGICATFKNKPTRIALLSVSVAFLVFGFIYMLRIPMPTGFEQMNFFDFSTK